MDKEMTDDLNTYYSKQHAVVTGGASGIGAAIAEKLSEVGMHITVMGRDQGKLLATADRFKAATQQVDISKPEDVRRGFAAAVDMNGPVTILVNNAGAAETSTFAKMRSEEHTS